MKYKFIQAWLDAEKAVEDARAIADLAYEAATAEELPENLRPAKARDIVEGAVIWYPDFKEPGFASWKLVREVLRPNDEWKAYEADDGCRYGLDGAFVEVMVNP